MLWELFKYATEPYMDQKGKGGGHHKQAVFSLVERGGKVRSFQVDKVTAANLAKVARENVDIASTLNTDESPVYRDFGRRFVAHDVINHSKKSSR